VLTDFSKNEVSAFYPIIAKKPAFAPSLSHIKTVKFCFSRQIFVNFSGTSAEHIEFPKDSASSKD
jgi:hypothetical protein